MKEKGSLLWLDLETTGLDTTCCGIIEVGIVRTTSDLEVKETKSWLIRLNDDVFWEPVAKQMHEDSGLIELVRTMGLPLGEVEDAIVRYLDDLPYSGSMPICGSSVHFDRLFMARGMPNAYQKFYHRSIDVSSLKELTARWIDAGMVPYKRHGHRAIDDCMESINELKSYRVIFDAYNRQRSLTDHDPEES